MKDDARFDDEWFILCAKNLHFFINILFMEKSIKISILEEKDFII